MKLFLVTVGAHSFGCMALDRATAYAQHVGMAERGERFDVVAVGGESFAVTAERQALATAHVREAIAC